MPTEQTTIANVMTGNPERVRRLLAWIEEQAGKNNLYDADEDLYDDLYDYHRGNADDARYLGERNGQIVTAQNLRDFLLGTIETLPEIENFEKDDE